MEENWMELYDFLEKTGFSYHISFKKIMARMGMEDVSRKFPVCFQHIRKCR